MIKTLNKMDIEEKYLNIIVTIYVTSLQPILYKGGNLKAFPLKSGTRQGCPLSPLLST